MGRPFVGGFSKAGYGGHRALLRIINRTGNAAQATSCCERKKPVLCHSLPLATAFNPSRASSLSAVRNPKTENPLPWQAPRKAVKACNHATGAIASRIANKNCKAQDGLMGVLPCRNSQGVRSVSEGAEVTCGCRGDLHWRERPRTRTRTRDEGLERQGGAHRRPAASVRPPPRQQRRNAY